MKHFALFGAIVLSVPASRSTQPSSSAAMDQLAETEREFAHAAAVKGWRAAFMEFYTDDALVFTPGPTSAQARLRSRSVRPPSEEELTWEPRTGDVAASGDLGWLTGPSTFLDHTEKPPVPYFGNYVSIWRRLPNGNWRSLIDIGTKTPELGRFPPGFNRMAVPSRYSGDDTQAAATNNLLAADRHLNERVTLVGAPHAYADVVNGSEARLHRQGSRPSVAVGSIAIVDWFASHPATITATTGSGEAARSGDLGYTYGTYELRGAEVQAGGYVRVWTRERTGRWLVEADVVSPTPSAR